MITPEILYEDNHVIVVVKPRNIPVQSDSSGDESLAEILKAYIKEKYNKPGNVYLGIVHRLDRPVGGVMVFARTDKAASRLSAAFASRKAKKKYVAVVSGKPKSYEQLSCYMRKRSDNFNAEICDKGADGAKSATLEYRKVSTKGNLSLLDIRLHSGRHHQIRLQLSSSGMPIMGDHRYNPEFINRSDGDIALFAYSLTFEHPTKKEMMTFTAKPTGTFMNKFSNELDVLCCGLFPAYVDDNIIAIDKPVGMTTAIADGGDNTAEGALLTRFAEIYPVHRLDATTSGLLLFARNEESRKLLDEAFSRSGENRIAKHYKCILVGSPKKQSAVLSAYLSKSASEGTVFVTPNKVVSSKPISTGYNVIDRFSVDGVQLCIAEVELFTGRTHQIRAHMAFNGTPILGDDKYGNRGVNHKLKVSVPQLRSVRVEFYFSGNSLLSYLDGMAVDCDADGVNVNRGRVHPVWG